MYRFRFSSLVCALTLLSFAPAASAHFGVIVPSNSIVSKDDSKTITLEVKFIHPMEGHYMDMEQPKRFGVMHQKMITDLLATLQPVKGKGIDQDRDFAFWKSEFSVKRPGDYTFFVEPAPYWEPSEDIYIIHYTKVCVNAFGLESGWDKPIGIETEIIPFTRPYGLWTGNVFTGKVLLNGKPVPYATIEVEYLNESSGDKPRVKAPSDPYVTQVLKADANGVFTYAMPRAGWWGFSALSRSPRKVKKENTDKAVEIGAVYWVRAVDMP